MPHYGEPERRRRPGKPDLPHAGEPGEASRYGNEPPLLTGRNLRLTVAYDGSRYRGWQRLTEDVPTVQGRIETVLSRLLGERVQIIGAGRTDAGVHAEAQVANFHTRSTRPAAEIMREANAYLPDDIAITACQEAPERFHARFHATAKTYRYRIVNRAVKDPFRRYYVAWEPERLDVELMRKAAAAFLGTHNFQSFTTLKEKDKSFERTVRAVTVTEQDGVIDILVTADGFLWNQVRIMAGALIEAGKGRLDAAGIAALIERRERAAAPGRADPRGLCLVAVEYGERPAAAGNGAAED